MSCAAHRSDDKITLFKGAGIATEDLGTAILTLETVDAT